MTIELKINKYSHKGEVVPFFENISLNIKKKGFYLLSGESGIGKSTLMKILLELNSGDLDGEIIFKSDTHKYTSGVKLRKEGKIGYQSDEFNFLPWESVEENIFLPSRINKNLSKISKSNLDYELNKLGLSTSVLDKHPHELSFGMKARLGLIRACIYNPEVLFLDELYSGIDDKNCDAINDYILEKKESSTIIAISHQIHKAQVVADCHFELSRNKEKIELLQHI